MNFEAARNVASRLGQYAEGTYAADIELLQSLFHPEAIMSGVLNGARIFGSPALFFSDLASRPSMKDEKAPYSSQTTFIHATDLVASATLLERGFYGSSFMNHFHLMKEADGRWLITSKLFHQL